MEERKTYDCDFKVNAVKLANKKNRFKVAKELGIATTNIYRWQTQFQKYGEDYFFERGQFSDPEQKRFSEQKRILKQKLKDTELEIEIFKNASKYILQGKPMIFHFIEENLHRYPICRMCKVLCIRTTTYYRWRDNIVSPRQLQTSLIDKEITSIFYENKERYGNYKISAELQSRGFKLQPCTVTGYMRKLGLTSKLSSRHKVKSIAPFIKKHNPCIFPNVLKRQFKADEPSQIWVSGITNLETEEGLLSLTIIMDLFDSKIIGWNLSTGATIMETSMPAWEMAVLNRKPKKGLIFHSDRSPQYANKMFTRKLNSYKYIKRSMSRKENHLDNAVAKRFFIALKSELASLDKLPLKKEMEEKIGEYLEQTSKVFKHK